MGYALPSAPITGIVTDARGLVWRRTTTDTWRPDECPTCGTRLAEMTWAALLEHHGPLVEVV